MEITTFTAFRENMKAYFEKVLDYGFPLLIIPTKGRDLVLMGKVEYVSIQETIHLFKSPKNAERLLKAVEQDKSEGGIKRDLLE